MGLVRKMRTPVAAWLLVLSIGAGAHGVEGLHGGTFGPYIRPDMPSMHQAMPSMRSEMPSARDHLQYPVFYTPALRVPRFDSIQLPTRPGFMPEPLPDCRRTGWRDDPVLGPLEPPAVASGELFAQPAGASSWPRDTTEYLSMPTEPGGRRLSPPPPPRPAPPPVRSTRYIEPWQSWDAAVQLP